MNDRQRFLDEHARLSRRFFLQAGAACVATVGGLSLAAAAAPPPPELAKVIDRLPPFFTEPGAFPGRLPRHAAAALAAGRQAAARSA